MGICKASKSSAVDTGQYALLQATLPKQVQLETDDGL